MPPSNSEPRQDAIAGQPREAAQPTASGKVEDLESPDAAEMPSGFDSLPDRVRGWITITRAFIAGLALLITGMAHGAQ